MTNKEPKTWADAEEDSAEFEALLEKYDGDYQAATNAQLRGETADPKKAGGNPNPM
jgi:hypothetical protein